MSQHSAPKICYGANSRNHRNTCRTSLPLAGVQGKYISLDSRHHHACYLHLRLLQRRSICRLRHQHLLSWRCHIRLDDVEGAFLRRTILKKTAANIENPQQKPPITRMPLHYLLPLTAVFAATFAGIAWILINFTDSNVPLLDSFTTALSIIGMWMLARKYVEQWWAWIGVDAVSAGLYVYKGLDFTAALYALYTIIAIFGYFKWKKMMKG